MQISTAVTRRIVQAAALIALSAWPAVAPAQERGATQNKTMEEYRFEPTGFLVEPLFIERAAIFGDRHFGNGPITQGLYYDINNMISGGGWLAAGPGYRRWYKHDSVFVDTSAAISWRGYKLAQARFELPTLMKSRFALGTQARLQDFTQIAFFGEGPDSTESQLSEYRLKSQNVVGYATFRPARSVDVNASIGWLSPSILPRGGTFKRDRPDARDLFPANAVYTRADQPTFVQTEAGVTADTRDYPGHPTSGVLLRGYVTGFADRDGGAFTFRRYEGEAAGFVPLSDSRIVLALRGWMVTSQTDDGQVVPFYLQPSLGGQNTLRSFADYRFHDRNMLLLNAEARVALMTHLDAAVFLDAGNVAARVGDLDLGKRSYGVGLRLHSRRSTFARLDFANGAEGWRMLVRLTEPFDPSRLGRRTAPAPFVP
jgi:hypothetical protein